MKIKTLSGEKDIDSVTLDRVIGIDNDYFNETWVAWSDIKPILDEYQSVIENEQQCVGCASISIDND